MIGPDPFRIAQRFGPVVPGPCEVGHRTNTFSYDHFSALNAPITQLSTLHSQLSTLVTQYRSRLS